MVGFRSIPPWLDALLNEKFFEPCLVHNHDDPPATKKPEKNIFCFDCCLSVCPKCLFRHRKHVLLQVRRYVYHDVLKLDDAERLMDCYGVQPYITNSAKVVFLRQRPLTRLFKSPGGCCFTCNRNLQDPFLFCSLSCKVQHVLSTQGSLKINLSNNQMLGFSDLDEHQVITPDSVLDSAGSGSGSGSGFIHTSSDSTASSDIRAALHSTATTEIVRKKRSSLSSNRGPNRPMASPQPTGPTLNRRKGVPNRSPMC